MRLTESALREIIRSRLQGRAWHEIQGSSLSEGIRFHLENGLPLRENIYRWGSSAHLAMIREARSLFQEGRIDVDADDLFLLETDLGETGIYNGREVPLDLPFEEGDEELDLDTLGGAMDEAEYQGRDVELNKPTRSSGPSKFSVYTRNEKGKVIKLGFGSKGIDIKTHSPERVRSFLARHNCDNPGPRWKARWWSCNLHRYKKQLGLKFKGRW